MLTVVKKWASAFEPENWPATRAKGKVFFVLSSGGLWALWMIAFHLIVAVLFLHIRPLFALVQAVLLWPGCGLLFGLLFWAALEGRYLESHTQDGLRKKR